MTMTVAESTELSETRLSPKMTCMTQPPKPRTQVADETGKTVAANVRRVRELRGLSTYDLSKLMGEVGRPIAASAIAKVERGERRVDVGDLTALAAVLRVNPSSLLLPLEDSDEVDVEITGGGRVSADVAWDWADGKRPLRWPGGDQSTASMEFRLYGRPPGRREEHGIVLRPRGQRGRQQVAEIREAYQTLQENGLDLRELQRLDVDAFEQLMREGDV
jgi:transcriptional regulator with XRE-family HTH domain